MPSNYKDTFIKSIPAGMIIGMGCIIYLTLENHAIGAFLFVLGLFTIYSLDLYLFTGKIGFLLEHKSPIKMLIIWIGNFVGAFLSAIMVLGTRIMENQYFTESLAKYVKIKTTDEFLSIFILGIFCGITMFIAAECYRKTKYTPNSIGGYFGMVLCVMLFLLAGFEHSIANMFYLSLNFDWDLRMILSLITVSLGNAVGGLLIPFTLSFTNTKTH